MGYTLDSTITINDNYLTAATVKDAWGCSLSNLSTLIESGAIKSDNIAAVNRMPIYIKKVDKYKYFHPGLIKDVQFYPPAVKMIFTDGTIMTATAHGDDVYDPYTGVMVCIFKYMFGDNTYLNMIRGWIKKAEKAKAEKEKEEKRIAEEKEIRERQAKKNAARKLLRKEARREEEIEMQKEAYLRAMKEKDAE